MKNKRIQKPLTFGRHTKSVRLSEPLFLESHLVAVHDVSDHPRGALDVVAVLKVSFYGKFRIEMNGNLQSYLDVVVFNGVTNLCQGNFLGISWGATFFERIISDFMRECESEMIPKVGAFICVESVFCVKTS